MNRQPSSPEAEKAREIRSRPVRDSLQVLVGAALAALCFNLLLRPNDVAPGGVVGLSLVLQQFVGLEPAYLQWAINAVILCWG